MSVEKDPKNIIIGIFLLFDILPHPPFHLSIEKLKEIIENIHYCSLTLKQNLKFDLNPLLRQNSSKNIHR